MERANIFESERNLRSAVDKVFHSQKFGSEILAPLKKAAMSSGLLLTAVCETNGTLKERIKSTMSSFGLNSEHIAPLTDTGRKRKNRANGCVVCIEARDAKGNVFSIPLGWYEIKSSSCCTRENCKRGNASSLILERESLCRDWSSCFGNSVKPLVALFQGSDFDEELGEYTINRIREGLRTRGNKNPYGENPNGVSWFYYKKSFTQGDMFKIVRDTLAENSRHVAAIISDIKKFKPKG